MKALRRLDLNSLRSFAAVADCGGFTSAAERMDTTKARISLDVSRLEKQLGANLFTRTTRRVMLTDAGRTLYGECIPFLKKVESAAEQLGATQTQLKGSLRITSTVDLASQSLARAAAAFAEMHPELSIELVSSDRVINLVKEGIDLALRVGWLRDSSMRALKLGEFEQYVVASPQYLARAGVPASPEDLESHAWVALTRLPTPLTWKFVGPNGERRTARVQARLRADTGSTLRLLIESGAGLSTLDSLGSVESLRAGRLQRVLTQWSLPKGGVYAVYPPGKHVAPAARTFVEFYRDKFLADADSMI